MFDWFRRVLGQEATTSSPAVPSAPACVPALTPSPERPHLWVALPAPALLRAAALVEVVDARDLFAGCTVAVREAELVCEVPQRRSALQVRVRQALGPVPASAGADLRPTDDPFGVRWGPPPGALPTGAHLLVEGPPLQGDDAVDVVTSLGVLTRFAGVLAERFHRDAVPAVFVWPHGGRVLAAASMAGCTARMSAGERAWDLWVAQRVGADGHVRTAGATPLAGAELVLPPGQVAEVDRVALVDQTVRAFWRAGAPSDVVGRALPVDETWTVTATAQDPGPPRVWTVALTDGSAPAAEVSPEAPPLPWALPPALASHRAAVAAALRPCVLLRPTDGPPEPGGSCLGGMPWWPEATPWPADAQGRPMDFVAQLDLGALPAVDGLPTEGLLQVFAGAVDLCRLTDGPADDGTAARVVYWPTRDPDAIVRAEPPPSAAPGPYRPRRAVGLAGHTGDALPCLLDHRVPALLRGLPPEARADLLEAATPHAHRLGGYPVYLQDDPLEAASEAWVFVVGFTSDDHVTWNDVGEANVFVRADDLAAGRFDRAWVHVSD